ncbi:UNVERIFIED_ORG: hypothetical protein LHK14_17805 [Roseateles sp. XES5]|nr:hypothetical protein [Roseateles sp. XES5]
MKKSVRKRHGEHVKYTVCVLWLIGYTERTIAKVVSLRTKQVAGIVGRSEYAGRATMTDAIRTEKLKELVSIRMEDGVPLDAGLLDRVEFKIIPLGTARAASPLRRLMG